MPEIRYYGSSIADTVLTFLLTFVALALVGGCVFSIDRFVRLTNVEGVLEKKLPKSMRNALYSTMGPFHKMVYEIGKDDNHVHLKRWVIPLTCSIFAVTWIAIIILKIV